MLIVIHLEIYEWFEYLLLSILILFDIDLLEQIDAITDDY